MLGKTLTKACVGVFVFVVGSEVVYRCVVYAWQGVKNSSFNPFKCKKLQRIFNKKCTCKANKLKENYCKKNCICKQHKVEEKRKDNCDRNHCIWNKNKEKCKNSCGKCSEATEYFCNVVFFPDEGILEYLTRQKLKATNGVSQINMRQVPSECFQDDATVIGECHTSTLPSRTTDTTSTNSSIYSTNCSSGSTLPSSTTYSILPSYTSAAAPFYSSHLSSSTSNPSPLYTSALPSSTSPFPSSTSPSPSRTFSAVPFYISLLSPSTSLPSPLHMSLPPVLHGSTALLPLLQRLHAAQRSIDVAVLLMTCDHLAAQLIQAKRRGVRVRVLIDQNMAAVDKSMVGPLRRNNICVRTHALSSRLDNMAQVAQHTAGFGQHSSCSAVNGSNKDCNCKAWENGNGNYHHGCSSAVNGSNKQHGACSEQHSSSSAVNGSNKNFKDWENGNGNNHHGCSSAVNDWKQNGNRDCTTTRYVMLSGDDNHDNRGNSNGNDNGIGTGNSKGNSSSNSCFVDQNGDGNAIRNGYSAECVKGVYGTQRSNNYHRQIGTALMHHKFAVIDAVTLSYVNLNTKNFGDSDKGGIGHGECGRSGRNCISLDGSGRTGISLGDSRRNGINLDNSGRNGINLDDSSDDSGDSSSSGDGCVVNGEAVVMSGSFNWTWSGVVGNDENVIITNMPEVVAAFAARFEELWEAAGS